MNEQEIRRDYNRYYDLFIKYREVRYKIDALIKNRIREDKNFKLPDRAKEVFNEVKERLQYYAFEFKRTRTELNNLLDAQSRINKIKADSRKKKRINARLDKRRHSIRKETHHRG